MRCEGGDRGPCALLPMEKFAREMAMKLGKSAYRWQHIEVELNFRIYENEKKHVRKIRIGGRIQFELSSHDAADISAFQLGFVVAMIALMGVHR